MIRSWDVATGRELPRLEIPDTQGIWLALAPDGRTLATLGKEPFVSLWDLTTNQAIRQLKAEKPVGRNESPFNLAVISPNGRFLAAGERGVAVTHLWNLATGREM